MVLGVGSFVFSQGVVSIYYTIYRRLRLSMFPSRVQIYFFIPYALLPIIQVLLHPVLLHFRIPLVGVVGLSTNVS